MKKIKIYDLEKWIGNQDFDGEKFSVFDFGKIAIIKGEKGIFAFNDEGIGFLAKNINYEIEMGLYPTKDENKIYLLPPRSIQISLKEIIDNVSYKEMELADFFQRYDYSDRLKNNFYVTLDNIENIGLNSQEYFALLD